MSGEKTPTITWEEVAKHDKRDDAWIVLNQKVYDVTQWAPKHPGGRVILRYAGQDATDAFDAFHPLECPAMKYVKALPVVGSVEKQLPLTTKHTDTAGDSAESSLIEEFRDLRKDFEKEGYFQASFTFYILYLAHIFAIEGLGYYVLYAFGVHWYTFLISGALLCTAQIQAGWLQHDFGHLSVFSNSKLNRLAHHFTCGFVKGAARSWWNWRHFNHHAKPNIPGKDPDIGINNVFVLGREKAQSWARRKKGVLPYQHQSKYWFFLGPPLLLPIYFHFEISYFLIKKRCYVDMLFWVAYYARYLYFATPVLGWPGAIALYFFVRFLESHWFVWVTQMNHIPMDISSDRFKNWPILQAEASCNVTGGAFNDWFTGHLNYQIEHHLFPTMPRHNYPKVAKRVETLFKKHNVPYVVKTLYTAFADIVGALKEYGDIWEEAYFH
eukprot:TRINITY_DN8358_c0_g1_i1.p1 TRINITY_DN8358_c0_g1~~TRINITY_DN8358_c0_g1_i1.p1  ORF type:complete len:452 (-),score=53.22 TRINITY_DN8358_c0_g1_i1:60-1376(-)